MSSRLPVPNCLHGWLPALVPAAARSFRVSDPELAASFRDAGAELDDSTPDVEILTPEAEPGGSEHVIVCVSAAQPEGGPLLVRAPRRAWASSRVRRDASRFRRALREQGYASSQVVMWDCEAPIYLPTVRDRRRGSRLAHLLPQRALVVAGRSGRAETVLETVAAEAEAAVGAPIRYRWPLASEGIAVAVAESCVLRIAIGPGRMRIDDQRLALQDLSALSPPPEVASRVPWLLCSGRTGLADWSAERTLPGRSRPRLPEQALADCLELLAALHDLSDDRSARTSTAGDAEIIAAFCDDEDTAEAVRALGRGLEASLVDLPRAYGHGDFWWRNLLLTGDRLTGVIEWDAAGPGRLPLLDLVHFLLCAHTQRTRQYLGVAVVEYLVPWARGGGDDVLRSFARRIGVEVDPELLEALALAYWLDRVASELRTFADRRRRPYWRARTSSTRPGS